MENCCIYFKQGIGHKASFLEGQEEGDVNQRSESFMSPTSAIDLLEALLPSHLVLMEPSAAVLTAEGTSGRWGKMVPFFLLAVQFPFLSLPFGKQAEASGQGSMKHVVFRLLPSPMEISARKSDK